MSEPAISVEARAAGRRRVGGSLGLALAILVGIAGALLGLLFTSQVYFNAAGFAVMWWSALGVGLLSAALMVRPLSRIGMDEPLSPLLAGAMVALLALPCLAGFTSLAVFTMAKTPAHFTARLEIVQRDGHCGLSYEFDNPPISRRLEVCGYSYGGMRDMNVMEVDEKIGPLGAAVQFFAPRRVQPAGTSAPQEPR